MGRLLLKRTFIISILFSVTITFAQDKKIEKGKVQYDRYQYIDAQKTYLKTIKNGFKDADLLKKLGNSYYFNSQFKEAQKWYKELVEGYPNEVEPEYYFRYAQSLKAIKNYKESDEYMNKFTELAKEDKRTGFFKARLDYLERIDFQSGRYEIENSTVNSSSTDFGTAFYGDYVVFASARDTLIMKKQLHQWNDETFLDLYQAEYDSTERKLFGVEKLSKKINSDYHESTPVFTQDGKTIYFTRNNFSKGALGKDNQGTTKLKIYRSYKKEDGRWTKPKGLPFNNDQYSTAHPALSPDEKTLYFSSDIPGGKGQSDLYKAAINTDGSFGEPESLGDRINTEGKETFPFISANNDLYFASNGHYGLGGLDVFVTRAEPASEDEGLVINVGKPVNSPKDDFAFIVDDKNKRGYFSSNREEGGVGGDDIYSFLQKEDVKSFCNTKIAGIVDDKDTKEILVGAKVILTDGNNEVVGSVVVGEDGKFSFEDLECDTKYSLKVEKEGYNTGEKWISTSDTEQSINSFISLEREDNIVGVGDDLSKVLNLNPIYFDFDQSYIREDASIELAKVIEFMNQYPELVIEVKSHTDSHGDDAYNLDLSDRRAKSTVKYMIKKGITSERLKGKGYGETQHVNDCGNDSHCTKAEHQLNRRSEFIIVK